jgi:protein-S-isoprenylcysteine O-methyltransferase Ste14
MDAFRYWLAVVLLCTIPMLCVYWPVVHGFIRFWRRAGPGVTYGVMLAGFALGASGLFLARGRLLGADFGTQWPLVTIGAACLALAGWLHRELYRDITNRFLVGMPELAPERYPQPLVRSGLYARVRHPRYLQMAVALLGYALVANYLSSYVLALLWLPGMYVTVLFEERELRERYGAEYDEYCRKVPRLVPRLRRADVRRDPD